MKNKLFFKTVLGIELGLSLITPSFSQNTEKIVSKTQDNLTQTLDYDATKHQEIINTPVEQLDELIIQKAMLWEINNHRLKHAKKTLKLNDTLSNVASEYAKYLFDNNRFSHINKDGLNIKDRIKEKGYNGNIYGENIASGQTTIFKVMQSWLKSKHHKENILDNDYEDFGVGYYKKGYKIFWVQNFLGSKFLKKEII